MGIKVELLTVKDAAKKIGISHQVIYKLIADEKIRSIDHNHKMAVLQEDLPKIKELYETGRRKPEPKQVAPAAVPFKMETPPAPSSNIRRTYDTDVAINGIFLKIKTLEDKTNILNASLRDVSLQLEKLLKVWDVK